VGGYQKDRRRCIQYKGANKMTNTTIYNKYNMLNEDGRVIDSDIHVTIAPLISKWVAAGYDPRDIKELIGDIVSATISEILLRKSLDMKRSERQQKE
jgi:hypothetical protein